MEHTPGPWTITDGYLIDWPTNTLTAVRVNGPLKGTVGYGIGQRSSGEQAQANANLIASAPDLLEACERVAATLEDGEALANQNAMEDMHHILVKAIAKAKGV